MRRPLTKPKPFGRAATTIWPAPIKGLRSDQGLAMEQPGAALRLRNWICETDAVSIRKGYSAWTTSGLDSAMVKTIMVYTSGTASSMWACAGDSVHAITTTTTGAAVTTGLTTSYLSWCNFTTSGGAHYLVHVNGLDNGRTYDGSSWADTSITGVSDNDLIYVFPFKSRLWFIEKTSDSAWYLGTGAISGAATEFVVGAVMKKGGRLIAGTSWSVDSGTGTGMDDMLVFITSEGEVIVYEMSDPDDATTILLKGVYDVGKPLGQRCFCSYGGDLLILTRQGLIPLSKVVSIDRGTQDFQAVTSPVRKDFADDATAYGGNTGWEVIIYPKENLGIINVPVSTTVYKQYCWNLLTGAFSDWMGINAITWALFSENLHFGAAGGLTYKGLTGSRDGSAAIQAEMVTTFSQMGFKSKTKKIELVRPIVDANQAIRGGVDVLRNFEAVQTLPENEGTVAFSGMIWGTSNWGAEVWGGQQLVREWLGGDDIGTAVALQYGVTVESDSATTDLLYRLIEFDVVFNVGGVLGG